MSLTPSRRIARRVIADVRSRQGWGHEIMSAHLARTRLDEADAAFATRLVYGVLAAEGTLDEALDRHIDRPGRVHPLVRDALRIAAYEVLFMRTPDRVAVHQGVEGVREVARSAAGLANAVLRRVAEDSQSFPWGDPETDIAALARQTGHPPDLAALLVEDLGWDRAHTMMSAGLEPAPLYLAHNPFRGSCETLLERLTAEGVEPRPCVIDGCIEAGSSSAAVRSETLAQGACIVVDAGAQFVASLAAPAPGGVAIDLAAGRGSKTLLMQAGAVRAGGPARIVGVDIHAYKVDLLRARMETLGVPGVTAEVVDATDGSALDALGGPGSVDVVLVDAPCSGLGTLRRHPEKRWRLTPQAIEEVATIAEGMLDTAASLVRPGGFVVYSTCTVTHRENSQVVSGFLDSPHGEGFETVRLDERVPEGWREFLTEEGWFSSYPRPGGPDGHFAAVLART